MKQYFIQLLALLLVSSSQLVCMSQVIAGSYWNLTTMPSPGNGNPPAVASDTAGNGVAVWGDQDGSTLYSSFYQNSQWSQPIPVATNTGFPVATVFAYDNGNASVVWQNQNDNSIYVSRYQPAPIAAWGPPLPAIQIAGGATFQVACDEQGNMALVYYDTQSGLINALTLGANAATWSAPQTLNSTPTMAYPTGIAVNSGLAVAVYTTNIGKVQANGFTFGTSTAWTSIGQPLAMPGPFTTMDVALNSSHEAALIFGDYVGLHLPVLVAQLDVPNATWSQLEIISTYHNALFPSIVIDSSDNCVATWFEQDQQQNFSVKSASCTLGVWSPAVTISAVWNAAQFGPVNSQLAVDAAGDVQALWNVESSSSSLIEVAEKPFMENWISAITLDTNGYLAPYSLIGGSDAIAGLDLTFAVWEEQGTNLVILGVDPVSPNSPPVDPPAQSSTLPPLSPREFVAKIKKSKGIYKLAAKWKRSLTTDVVHYEVYVGKKLIATIPAGKKLVFKKRLHSRKIRKEYLIYAVDALGIRSLPHKLKFKK